MTLALFKATHLCLRPSLHSFPRLWPVPVSPGAPCRHRLAGDPANSIWQCGHFFYVIHAVKIWNCIRECLDVQNNSVMAANYSPLYSCGKKLKALDKSTHRNCSLRLRTNSHCNTSQMHMRCPKSFFHHGNLPLWRSFTDPNITTVPFPLLAP